MKLSPKRNSKSLFTWVRGRAVLQLTEAVPIDLYGNGNLILCDAGTIFTATTDVNGSHRHDDLVADGRAVRVDMA